MPGIIHVNRDFIIVQSSESYEYTISVATKDVQLFIILFSIHVLEYKELSSLKSPPKPILYSILKAISEHRVEFILYEKDTYECYQACYAPYKDIYFDSTDEEKNAYFKYLFEIVRL